MRFAIFFSIPLAIVLLMPQSSKHTAGSQTQGSELDGEFAEKNGPDFPLAPQHQALVDEVIGEMKGGYGGTLVTKKGPDKTIDSSAFLSRYLREFSSLENNHDLKNYDYRFETILARASEYPVMLDDPRLDWDIYRSLLLYERFSDGTDQYEERTGKETSVYELDSAKDLAWMYIDRQSDRLMQDKARQRWWVEHLVRGLNVPKGARVNRWFLLQLCALTDPNSKQISAADESGDPQMRKPSAEDPFLIVQEDTKPPAFNDALHMIAHPLGLSVEVWGIDSAKMLPARILPVSLELRKWPTDRSHIIGQESWSEPKEGTFEYKVRFFHVVGQRAPYSNVSIPSERKDGVFFFPFNKRLYVWPKAEMDDGVLKIARVAGLIDNAMWAQLAGTSGFHQLQTTLSDR